ncbi:D-lactate dehydrogenase [Prochlorococcus marinus]|uniref:D-lactate dehydrogenase n=1 Tax=Prochlorococcus marinus TaxID=1219 RepID=UPI0022B59608|nr:D-lactate dehydrogenase [Prochlorococcus marinus]
MKNYRLLDLYEEIVAIVGKKKILTDEKRTHFYRTGIRFGNGQACMVVLPENLVQFWKVLVACISFQKIIIVQAANTGLTGGSTPCGDDYDRDVIIINTLKINQLIIINNGSQTISFPGTTLYQLEEKLLPLGRGPHSKIGSSCIGASVVGGVCNNSGGNLVNRGPAYTELSLFARLNQRGQLELINHLGIDLGNSPEEILRNLESINFNNHHVESSDKIASDIEYKTRVRDVNSDSPARFNADSRRLYEASGCAGKIAVFAVRLDTFPLPKQEQVFFVGTNSPDNFNDLRHKILLGHDYLPDMGEYMHRSYFDGADKYCKDNFLFIKYFGTKFLPKVLYFKRLIDEFTNQFNFLPKYLTDKFLQFFASKLPDHIPNRIRSYRNRFEHYMLFLSSDQSIELMEKLLIDETFEKEDYEYIKCTKREGDDALLHRYVAGSAPSRYKKIHSSKSGELLALDVALPRNCKSWYEILPQEILSQMAETFQMGHFLCMVFHWDFVLKDGADIILIKEKIFSILDQNNAKYPAEHNVGHLYKAENDLDRFYRKLDPTNTFNSGIGQTSKKKNYE